MKQNPELTSVSTDTSLVKQLADEYRKWASLQDAKTVRYCVECLEPSLLEFKHCRVHLHTH